MYEIHILLSLANTLLVKAKVSNFFDSYLHLLHIEDHKYQGILPDNLQYLPHIARGCQGLVQKDCKSKPHGQEPEYSSIVNIGSVDINLKV